jgi:hypothetical protein
VQFPVGQAIGFVACLSGLRPDALAQVNSLNTGKRHILAEIKRLAEASGGKPPGVRAFERETSIKESDWYPHLWLRWGDALEEAGFTRNVVTHGGSDQRISGGTLRSIGSAVGHLPIRGELIRESKADPAFPSKNTFFRSGGKRKLLKAVVAFCHTHPGFDDVLGFCESAVKVPDNDADSRKKRKPSIATGFVYLMKSWPHYKIGRTNSLGRREWELGIKIPVPPRTIHLRSDRRSVWH